MNLFSTSPFCKHEYINDVSTGSYVCYICGYVSEDSCIFGEEFGRSKNAAAPAANTSARPLAKHKGYTQTPPCYDMIIREFLYDCLAPVHMDSSFLIDRTVGLLYEIAMENKLHEKYMHLSVNLARDRGRLAYVLWDALKMEKSPRPPMDLAVMLNTTTAFMRMAEKELDRQPSQSHLADHVQRLAGELYLPGWCTSVVEDGCWHTTPGNAMVPPEHMVGAILLELGDMLKSHVVGMAHALNAQTISTVIGCSVQRIVRLQDRITVDVKGAMIGKLLMLAQKKKIHVHDLACLLAVHQASKMNKSL